MMRVPRWLLPAVLALLWLGAMLCYVLWQSPAEGRLRGVVLAEETGRPLANAHLRLSEAAVAAEHDFFTRADGSFQTGRLPAGNYRLTVSTQAHRLGPVAIAIEEGVTREVSLELSPVNSFFEMSAPWHTVTLDETPQVIASGFVTSQVLSFHCYRVDPEALFDEHNGSLFSLLHGEYVGDRMRWQIGGNPALAPDVQFDAPITRHDAEGLFRERIDLPPLRGKPGIYLVVAQADSLEQVTWVTVTSLGIIAKRWGDEALSYVVDLKTGEPVSEAKVEFALGEGGRVAGRTDRDGLFQAQLPVSKKRQDQSLFVHAWKGGSSAFLSQVYWQEGGDGQTRVYSYTDRPVYRPGHLVSFKGIVRTFAGEKYLPPTPTPVKVEAWDSRETLVYKSDLDTDSFGGFDGQLHLNEEAATGLYRLVSTVGGKPYESYFKVAEYRKPEYSIDLTAGKKRYVRGERMEVDLSAEYYFGAPVAGAEVSYSVYRSPHSEFVSGEEEGGGYSQDEGGDYLGEAVQKGSARTDDGGKVHLSIPTQGSLIARWQEEANQEQQPVDYDYTVEATVTDPSRKQVSGRLSVLVTQGEYFLTVKTSRFVASPGEEVAVDVLAQDYDLHPVANARVQVSAGREVWTQARSRFEQETQQEITTNAKGTATFHFAPRREGGYSLRARARDSRGNRIAGSSYLWVTGEQYSDLQVEYPQLEIIADKPVYHRGDTATLLINTEYKGATALVSIEGPRLYRRWLVPLKGSSTRVSVPIQPEYAPNFFFTIALIRNKQFASQEKRINVSVEERQLRVSVKPNKDRYAPGERATYEVTTTDWQGRPVPAELSLGIVDESIYAIQEDTTEPMLRFFYPPRENAVNTTYSFYQIYLDANKEAVSIKVRKQFPDTAYWNPRLITGADGKGSISFPMPDTLTTWRATARAITRDTAVGEAVAKAKCSKDLLVRLEMPRFATQRDHFTLSALAHNYTRATQAIAIWLHAPGLSFAARPGPDEKQRYDLASDGVQRQDWHVSVPGASPIPVTAYLKAEGGLSDAVELPLPVVPHGRERVEWRSGAQGGGDGSSSVGTERIFVRQDSVPGASDVRVRLAPSLAPVILGALDYLATYPYGCTEQTMSSFLPDVVVARALRQLNLPNAPLEKRLPDMVLTGLNRLYSYQHSDGGWGWWQNDRSDPWMTAYVVFGLLVAKQNGFAINNAFLEGGLSWLARAARPLGQSSPLQFAPRYQWQPRWPAKPGLLRQNAYLLYVLALAGRGEAADPGLSLFSANLRSLDSYTLALVASALLARGREREAKEAAKWLWGKALQTQALAFWKGSEEDGRGGDTETTAVAFQALRSLDPSDARLPRVVRWLLLNREGNHWVSTRDTAFVLYAITDYLKDSQELQPDYQLVLRLNGKQLLSRRFTQADLFSPEVEVKVSGDALPQGNNLLTLEQRGRGNLYYTLISRQYVGPEDMTELITGAGISVDRQYYRMESRADPRTGVITTGPAPRPSLEFRSGEAVLARLTIRSPREYEYVIVEDPLPAGCEVAEQTDETALEWDRWWSHLDVRDRKVAIFARHLPKGTSVIDYHLRPQIPGSYHVMPTEVYSMYNPELRGSGAEARVELR